MQAPPIRFQCHLQSGACTLWKLFQITTSLSSINNQSWTTLHQVPIKTGITLLFHPLKILAVLVYVAKLYILKFNVFYSIDRNTILPGQNKEPINQVLEVIKLTIVSELPSKLFHESEYIRLQYTAYIHPLTGKVIPVFLSKC